MGGFLMKAGLHGLTERLMSVDIAVHVMMVGARVPRPGRTESSSPATEIHGREKRCGTHAQTSVNPKKNTNDEHLA